MITDKKFLSLSEKNIPQQLSFYIQHKSNCDQEIVQDKLNKMCDHTVLM